MGRESEEAPAAEGARFGELLKELASEHARLRRELEQCRREATRPRAPPLKDPCPVGHALTPVTPSTPSASIKAAVQGLACVGENSFRVELPRALGQRRWAALAEEEPPPSPRGEKAYKRLETSKVERQEGQLELHCRWHDIYMQNEAAAEVEDALTMAAKASRKTTMAVTSPQKKLQQLKEVNLLSPHGRFRFAWDLAGVVLLLHDMLMIPLQLAWELDPTLYLSVPVAIYWLLDVVVHFNTAYFDRGSLVRVRALVAKRYLRGWFLLDALLVLLEVLALTFRATFKVVRGAARALRLVRILKIRTLTDGIEELFIERGIQRLVLIFAVLNIVVGIFLAAHVLACIWYFMGAWQLQSGSGWMTLVKDLEDLAAPELYLRSLYWVLGHIVAAPVDPDLAPQSHAERLFTVLMIFASLLVVGAGISKMADTILELGRENAAARDIKRRLQQILRASGANRDLCQRIVRFAQHSHQRTVSLSVDTSLTCLLSTTLLSELVACQRSHFLEMHPFFELVKGRHADSYMRICSAFRMQIYCGKDVVFEKDTLSELLYITLHGAYAISTPQELEEEDSLLLEEVDESNFRLSQSMFFAGQGEVTMEGGCIKRTFDDKRFLCEAALFAKTIHRSSLETKTYADAFVLSGAELLDCVRTSPRCIGLVYRYAREYLLEVSSKRRASAIDFADLKVSASICHRIDQSHQSKKQSTNELLSSPEAEPGRLRQFLKCMDMPDLSADDVSALLPEVFGELHHTQGAYAKMSLEGEHLRATAAVISIVWLLNDRYDLFTVAQPMKRRLSRKLWQEMRKFLTWADLSAEDVHTVIVFLVLRGLSKSTVLMKALPQSQRSPEAVMNYLLSYMCEVVPSFRALSGEQQELFQKMVSFEGLFNFAQLLQGEAAPCQIAALQELVCADGVWSFKVFKASLLGLVGVMCGLRGAEAAHCSIFMDQENASTVLMGLHALQSLGNANPEAIYWSYIVARARKLGLPTEDLDHLAIARLACLTRASNPCELAGLVETWEQLSLCDRQVLTRHLVADGIFEPTCILKFLPAYLANARKNQAVGLRRALVVLIDLLEQLAEDGHTEVGELAQVVDLQDLSDFALRVKCRAVFMAVNSHSSVVPRASGDLAYVVSTQHKQREGQVNWVEDPARETKTLVRRLQRQAALEHGEAEERGRIQFAACDEARMTGPWVRALRPTAAVGLPPPFGCISDLRWTPL